MKNLYLIMMVLLVLVSGCSKSSVDTSKIVILQKTTELFLDDQNISYMDGVERVLNQPTKHSSNPLVQQSLPWESRMGVQAYGTVLREDDIYKLWYLTSQSDAGIPAGAYPASSEYVLAYLESDDGLNWDKPLIGNSYGDYEATNIIADNMHSWSIYVDESSVDCRYRAAGGRLTGCSVNGLDWTTYDWPEVGKNDTQTSLIQWKGKWLAYVRDQGTWENGVLRRVAISTSDDFKTWTPKQSIFDTDIDDGAPWVQPYAVQVVPYGNQLVGFLQVIHLNQVMGNNSEGFLDIQLVTSRDGNSWSRVADRQTFLSTGLEGSFDYGVVQISNGLIEDDNELKIYYSGKNTLHGVDGTRSIGLAILGLDRFVGLHSEDGGFVETKPVDLSHDYLIVNCTGDVTVDLLDSDDNIVEGFSDSTVTRLDDLHVLVQWDDASKLSEVGTASIRFTLEPGATLYSYKFGQI